MRRDVVISGVGMVSALGIGRAETAAAAAEGETALAPASRVQPPAGCSGLAGEVPTFSLEALLRTPKTYLDRSCELQLAACSLALSDSRLLENGSDPLRTGLAIGSAWGPMDTMAAFFTDYVQKGPRLVKPVLFPHSYANAAISLAAMEWELRGPHLAFATGRVASGQAFLAALDALRDDDADAMLAGGCEALGATLWRALAEIGWNVPPGEGAACCVLEQEAHAAGRHVQPLARLLGAGQSAGPRSQLAATAAAAMRAALDDAGAGAADITWVSQSACGWPAVDEAEAAAIDAVVGRRVERGAPARLHGDTQGAMAAMQVSLAALTLAEGGAAVLVLTCDPTGTATALVLQRHTGA